MSTESLPVALRSLNLRRSLVRIYTFVELRWAFATNRTNQLIRRRFNRWAKRGLPESMERQHAQMAETIWQRMELSATDRILDLGCGDGWACRLLAHRAPQGCTFVGIDISDQMIRRAREKSGSLSNVTYQCGAAEHLPHPKNYFTKTVSISAFYYFKHQDQVLRELFRVTQPGGELYLLFCIFQDDPPQPKAWAEDIALPIHIRGISEYEEMVRRAGWADVTCQVFDFRRDASTQHDAHDRPLLITARKPC